jgi:uncharacterized membrane protein
MVGEIAISTAKGDMRSAEKPSQLALRLASLEALAPRLLVVMIVLWVALVFVASVYKYETYGQGYDQVDYEQAIWNTTQGRFMEDSRFNFTGSVFGMDWMPMLIFFVPAYALLPSAHTLFFLQILGAALGAIPIFWLARDKLGSKLAGLGFGAAYLLYPVLLYGVLNPFQDRLFAVSLLLFAFYFYEKRRWLPFWICALLAMLARTDVAFVVAMFGIYGLLTRRRWPDVVAPLLVGLCYLALATYIIVPAFIYPGAFAVPAGPITDPMACWPCGLSPQLAYYADLGRSAPEIVAHIVTHPVETAQLVFTGPKIEYMLSLLLPLLFLPLLSARPLVLGLPILALNLLSTRPAQYSYQHHYSLLLIPGLFAAAIYGMDNLARLVRRTTDDSSPSAHRRTIVRLRLIDRRPRRLNLQSAIRNPQLFVLVLVVWAVIMQVPFKNPAVSAFLYPEPLATVSAANELVKMVPQDAKVAVSSKLAPHLLPRRYIYNFPPAPYSPYNFGVHTRNDYTDLDYILLDSDASALALEDNKIGGKSGLEVIKESPEWHLVAQKEGLQLYKRQ